MAPKYTSQQTSNVRATSVFGARNNSSFRHRRPTKANPIRVAMTDLTNIQSIGFSAAQNSKFRTGFPRARSAGKFFRRHGNLNVKISRIASSFSPISPQDSFDADAIRFWLAACTEPREVNIRDSEGRTILIRAAAAGALAGVQVLLEDKRVEVNAGDRQGSTALHVAVERGYTDIVEELAMDDRADIEKRDGFGCTALDIAQGQGRWRARDAIVASAECRGVEVGGFWASSGSEEEMTEISENEEMSACESSVNASSEVEK